MSKTVLCIIDPQRDFHEGGSLAVPGATEDSRRTAVLIDKCGQFIDEIWITLDTHTKLHIAHPCSWHGPPPPFTVISHQDLCDGKWTPVGPPSMLAYAKWYTKRLESSPSQLKLIVWPEHCLLGSPGHAVEPVLFAAIQRWSELKRTDANIVTKGLNRYTEMYSAVAAEVPLDRSAVEELASLGVDLQIDNTTTAAGHSALVNSLMGNDVRRLLVCGQALSHCVNFTVRDLLRGKNRSECSRVTLLLDACSAVTGFEREATQFVSHVLEMGGAASSCSEMCALLKGSADSIV